MTDATTEQLGKSMLPTTSEALNALIDARIKMFMADNLSAMVAAAMPPPPEVTAALEAERAESAAAEQSTRARKAREREEKRASQAVADAAQKRAAEVADATAAFRKLRGADVLPAALTMGDITLAKSIGVSFDDGNRFSLDAPIALEADQCVVDLAGRQVLVNRDITIGGEADEMMLTGASLILTGLKGKGVKVIRALLGARLPVGAGRSAKLPAGSLAFKITVEGDQPADQDA